MATEVDLQRLVVQMEASFTKYQREWQKALGTTDANVKRVQTRFDGMSKTIGNQGRGTARALQPIGLETSNIAAQFQDIAVQLQSGQSPFTIALQQGTQLSAVLGSRGGGVRGTLTALAAGFGSMINPVSLATIAIIGLGGAAVQWLTRTEEGVESTDDAFDAHIKRIKEITRGYDEAEKAALDYIERQRALPQEIAQNEAATGQTDALARASTILDEINAKQQEIAGDLSNLRLGGDLFTDLINAATGLDDLGLSAESTEQEVNALLVRLDTLARSDAPEQARNYARDLYNLVLQFRDAKTEAGGFKAILDNLPREIRIRLNLSTNAQSALQQLKDLAPELRDASIVAREEAVALAERASVGAQSIAEGMAIAAQLEETLAAIDEAERRRKEGAGGSGGGGTSDINSEREAVADLISELQHELDILGLTEQEKAVANALRRAGAAATDEERARIVELINATHLERQAIKATQDSMREFADISKQALSGFISDLRQGKSATEALGNALGNIGDRLLNKGLDLLFGAIFPFAEGGIAAHGRPLKRFANGGVSRSAAIFGEAGPEAAVPLPDGRRIPVELRMPSLGAVGGKQSLDIHIVSDDEKFSAYVTDKAGNVVAQASPAIIAASVNQSAKRVPGAMAQFQQQRAGGDYRVG